MMLKTHYPNIWLLGIRGQSRIGGTHHLLYFLEEAHWKVLWPQSEKHLHPRGVLTAPWGKSLLRLKTQWGQEQPLNTSLLIPSTRVCQIMPSGLVLYLQGCLLYTSTSSKFTAIEISHTNKLCVFLLLHWFSFKGFHPGIFSKNVFHLYYDQSDVNYILIYK